MEIPHTLRDSLLIPPNPAFSASPELHPRGGILINGPHHAPRPSEPSPTEPGADSSGSNSSFFPAQPVRVVLPSAQAWSHQRLGSGEQHHRAHSLTQSPLPSPGLSASGGDRPRIRFAPLPDPRRQRSLSTGRNIALTSRTAADGVETRGIALVGLGSDEALAVQGDDDDDRDGDSDSGDDEHDVHGKSGRNWSKTMGSSWKGTKKLLSGKNPIKDRDKDDSGYGTGAPLARSSSTGGLMGSSPFRWTLETERKHHMQGPPPTSVASLLSARRPGVLPPTPTAPTTSKHTRRSSSRDASREELVSSSLPVSPGPVKMLNGRVYGSRRASEIAEREEDYRRKLEPAFVEWGSAGAGSAVSVPRAATTGRGGFLGEDDDGGGMAWVRKRREERQRKERLEREEEDKVGRRDGVSPLGGLSSDDGSEPSLTGKTSKPRLSVALELQTPAIDSKDLPSHSPTILQYSAATPSPIARRSAEHGPIELSLQAEDEGNVKSISSTTHGVIEKKAMVIPSDKARKQGQQFQHGLIRDTFGDDASLRETEYDSASSSDEQDGSGDSSEDEDGDGDFDDDDEEELDAVRTTSSAAAVEVVSRHKE